MADRKVRLALKRVAEATRRAALAQEAADAARRAAVTATDDIQRAIRAALKDGTVVGDRAYQIGNSVYVLQRRKVSHDTIRGYADGLTHDLIILPLETKSRLSPASSGTS